MKRTTTFCSLALATLVAACSGGPGPSDSGPDTRPGSDAGSFDATDGADVALLDAAPCTDAEWRGGTEQSCMTCPAPMPQCTDVLLDQIRLDLATRRLRIPLRAGVTELRTAHLSTYLWRAVDGGEPMRTFAMLPGTVEGDTIVIDVSMALASGVVRADRFELVVTDACGGRWDVNFGDGSMVSVPDGGTTPTLTASCPAPR